MVSLNIEAPTVITWASLVKDLLFIIGLGNYWESQYVANEVSFINTFKQRIQDIFVQDWTAQVSLTSDNRLFKYIKVDFRFEKYLMMYNKAFRVALTKIRLSSHPFIN